MGALLLVMVGGETARDGLAVAGQVVVVGPEMYRRSYYEWDPSQLIERIELEAVSTADDDPPHQSQNADQ